MAPWTAQGEHAPVGVHWNVVYQVGAPNGGTASSSNDGSEVEGAESGPRNYAQNTWQWANRPR